MQKVHYMLDYPEATLEFNEHENRFDGEPVASSLSAGLVVLRDSFYQRLHDDVERIIGKDSMLIPVSEWKSSATTKNEIDLYQIAESGSTARISEYVSDESWYLRWLARLRLTEADGNAKVNERIAFYLSKAPHDRQLAFTDVLAKIFPESRQAPLILFQLFPLAIQVATALAFGDHRRAFSIRDQQAIHLPVIRDCHECHGALLQNGEQCGKCDNPLWKTEILVAD